MYENPVIFPQITNRESWLQSVQVSDDDTGDLISLLDDNGNALYAIALEIRRSHHGDSGYSGPSPYYDDAGCDAVIYANLAQGAAPITAGSYIAIVDTGVIDIQIPKSIMKTLHGRSTYDVYLTIEDTAGDDGRQLLIGRLPVFQGGSNT